MSWKTAWRSVRHKKIEERSYYAYEPLGTANSIRLLKVDRSDRQSTSRDGARRNSHNALRAPDVVTSYALIHTTITDAPRYDTLSYVWGTSVRDQLLPLECGILLRITKTLRDALPHISAHCVEGYIWIDQICINQEDMSERSQQVSIMGSIYSRCSSVVVWLGSIQSLNSDLRDACLEASSFDPFDPKESELCALLGRLQRVSQTTKTRKEVENGLCAILSAPWWTRAWVFQEVVLPLNSKFLLGGKSTVTLSGLRWVLRYYWRLIYEAAWAFPLGPFEGGESMREMYKLWNNRFKPNVRPDTRLEEVLRNIYFLRPGAHDRGLRALLHMHDGWIEQHKSQPRPHRAFEEVLSAVTSRAKTSNKLDQIYAYLGLNDDMSIQIKPDYEAQPEAVLLHIVQLIIRGTSRLDIFETLPRHGVHVLPFRLTFTPLQNLRERFSVYADWIPTPTSSASSVPSWCPDYWRGRLVEPFRTSAVHHVNIEFPHLMYPWAGSCDNKILRAHGRIIDTIQCRLTDDSPEHANDTTDEYLNRLLRTCIKAWRKSNSHATITPIPTMERLLQAMRAGGHTNLPNVDEDDVAALAAQIIGSTLDDALPVESTGDLRTRVMTSVKTTMSGRNLYRTTSALFATGTRLRRGDIICILHGCSNPVALRSTKEGRYLVKGTCFLEGWMDPWSSGRVDWQEDGGQGFELI